MKPSAWLFSAAMSFSCLALAQTAPKSQVTENTDPAKIAEIERHAQELAERPKTSPTQTQKSSTSKSKSKSKAKSKPAKKAKPPADEPMAPETKG